jgi:hypothetical protein
MQIFPLRTRTHSLGLSARRSLDRMSEIEPSEHDRTFPTYCTSVSKTERMVLRSLQSSANRKASAVEATREIRFR